MKNLTNYFFFAQYFKFHLDNIIEFPFIWLRHSLIRSLSFCKCLYFSLVKQENSVLSDLVFYCLPFQWFYLICSSYLTYLCFSMCYFGGKIYWKQKNWYINRHIMILLDFIFMSFWFLGKYKSANESYSQLLLYSEKG